ncbi:MAG: LytTR family DNA-binding domain-containing protein [Cellvibrio sp.]
MIKTVIVVDDEPLARVNLRKVIEQFTDWKIVLELENGTDLETYVEQLKPSLVFLDIRMPKRNGLSAASGLLKLEDPPLVVFVSAYTEYALQAFELYALDYLLKPFSDERFKQTVARLNSLATNNPNYQEVFNQQQNFAQPKKYLKVLIVRSVSIIQIVDLKDVIWFRGSGNYVEVMLQKETHLHRVSISFLESNLDPKEFVRCHRSAIVRLSAIKEIKTQDDGQLIIGLENGDSTKLSQTYKDSVLQIIEQQ